MNNLNVTGLNVTGNEQVIGRQTTGNEQVIGRKTTEFDGFEFYIDEISNPLQLALMLIATDPTEKQKRFLDEVVGLNITDKNGKQYYPKKYDDVEVEEVPE